jgi:hypothetical protein
MAEDKGLSLVPRETGEDRWLSLTDSKSEMSRDDPSMRSALTGGSVKGQINAARNCYGI